MNDRPPPASAASSRLADAARRLRACWWLKLPGLATGMTLFFVAYFQLLHHPSHPPVVMPLTAVDRWVAFQPAALPLYLSLWGYVSLVPGMVLTPRELLRYALAALGLSITGLGIFFLWPTAVPAPEVTWADDSLFAFLKATDASGNACPSLHVAFAVFTALLLGRLLQQMSLGRGVRALNWLWCAGIVYSTLATRQHVFLDAAAGAALGALFGTLHLCLGENAKRQMPDAK